MVGVSAPNLSISYAYDADGVRVSKTVNGVKTEFLVDNNRDYAQVLEESVNGLVAASYVYGLDLISQERGSADSFYLVDGLGSTRGLTDGAGNVTDTYSYDAFGNLGGVSGGTKNDYLFAGEQFDGGLGQYYLRQRYYDSRSGRFTRRDTYEGSLSDPISLHKYLYGNANPVTYTDPSGLFSAGEAQAAADIANTLAGIQWESGQHLIFATLSGGNYGLQDIIASISGTVGLVAMVPLLKVLWSKIKTTQLAGAASGRAGMKLPPRLRVNPNYPGKPSFAGRQPRNMNCVNCAVAVDQVLAGKTVKALPDPSASGFAVYELEDLYNNYFVDVSSKAEIEVILGQAGTGARGIVYGEGDMGHVFNVANLGGEIVFIDGQSRRLANVEQFRNLALLIRN